MIIWHTASQVMYDYGEYLWFQGITPIYHRHHHHRGRHPHRHWPTTSTSTSPSMFLDCNKYGLNSSYILVSFRAYQSIVNGEAEGCSSWHDIFSRKTHPETQRAAARKSGSWPTARLGESTSVEFPIDQITGFKVVKFTLWLFNIAMV